MHGMTNTSSKASELFHRDAAAGIVPEVLVDVSVAGDVLSEADRDIRAVISEADVPVPKTDFADVPAAVIPETQGKK